MIPKYEKIKQAIAKEIREGVFLPGDKIYSEDELKNKFQVSSTTVVKALNDLVMDGVLIRRQGKGTFVRRNLFNRPMYVSEQTLTKGNAKQPQEELKIFTFDNIEQPEVNEILGEGNLFKVTQVSLINDFAWKIQIRYVLSSKLSEHSKTTINNGGSVSTELGYADNMINFPSDMDISSVIMNSNHPLIADLDDKMKAKIGDENRAVLKIARVVKNIDEDAIEFDIRYIHSDFFKLSISTHQK